MGEKKMKKKNKLWNSRCVQNWICMLSIVIFLTDLAGIVLICEKNDIYNLGEVAELTVLDSYEKTDTFWNAFLNETLVRLQVSRAQFIYGDLNVAKKHGKTEVDLGYLDHIAYGDELTGITYYLEDLLNWDMVYIESYRVGDEISFTEEGLPIGEVTAYEDDEDATTATEGVYHAKIVNEQYYPVSDTPRSLNAYAQTPEQLEEYVEKLQRTMAVIWEMDRLYEEPVANYNVRAAIVSRENGLMYSSISLSQKEAALPYEELNTLLEGKVKESGAYVICKNGGGYESNLDLSVRDISDYWMEHLNLAQGDIIYMWVDTGYLRADSLQAGYLLYTDYAWVFRTAFIVLGAAVILFFVSLIRRIILEAGEGQSGRKIENWKTEFLFVECFAAGAVAIGITGSLLNELSYYGNIRGVMVLGIAIGLSTVFFLMVDLLYFGMEIIRRLKERTFYKKSLLKCLVSVCMKMILLLGSRIRFMIGYLAFLFINLIAVLSQRTTVFFFFLMAIVDLFIGGLILWYLHEQDLLREQMQKIADGEGREKLNEEQFHLENRKMAEHINQMDLGIKRAVDISLRDERLKTELITNVSHDIKTPLTSIITYVDLLSKEPLDTDNEKQYVEVLEQKSNRLKQLIEDLMEASKINSGSITVNEEHLHMQELISQVCAEYETRLDNRKLQIITAVPEEELVFTGDSRHTWRVFTNLFSNVCKYAMPGTRVYLETGRTVGENVYLELKNISEQSLNISPEELTERFVRGDESRNTEGNGLGLSIAKSLMQTMGGSMEVAIDGDLFKVRLVFAK